jgi:serine/threonine protein kinase
MMFEMATGDFLFEPRKGKSYGKDDDHLAQMMELLGRLPRKVALTGRLYKRFFDRSGHLRSIRGLSYWPLKKVLVEKYRFKEYEAQSFADFLILMLDWDPDRRFSAQKMLDHPWLKMPANYETRMTEEELAEYLQRQQMMADIMEPAMHGEEMSKLDDTDREINGGDREDN